MTINVTDDQASQEPKKDGCCGGGQAKDPKAQLVPKEQAIPSGPDKHAPVHHAEKGSGCYGDAKTSK